MALPPAASDRQLKHRRSIDVQVYARDHGLWEVDAHLSDTKTHDMQLAGQRRAAGQPIHDMLLRLVVDGQLNILEAGAETRWMPYAGECDSFGDAYGQLVGLNLARGFRRAVAERLGGTRGCTHLTELAQVLPTAVIQAFGSTVLNAGAERTPDSIPFQIDRCRTYRRDGQVVRLHYPRWYRATAPIVAPPPATDDPTH